MNLIRRCSLILAITCCCCIALIFYRAYEIETSTDGTWKIINFCAPFDFFVPFDNATHIWEGYLYYYGDSPPETIVVKTEKKEFDTTEDAVNTYICEQREQDYMLKFFDFCFFTASPKASFLYLISGDKPNMIVTIYWNEDMQDKMVTFG